MTPSLPDEVLERTRQWSILHRWERKRLAQELRGFGLTYAEIQQLVPVPKSTLSTWCSRIELSSELRRALAHRTGTGGQRGVPRDTQWRRRVQLERIREDAREYAVEHLSHPLFVAGVCLYWAEGSKTRNDFSVSNSDPVVLRTFIRFVREHLDADASFGLALNLHSPDDDREARLYWTDVLRLDGVRFTKSYIKKPGTGHRKKRLEFGVCRVRVDRGSDHWHRTMQWIETVGSALVS